MKRIALLAIAAAGAATLAATQLTAAEDSAAAKPAASAETPKKEGCDRMKRGGHRWGGPRNFHRRGAGLEHGPMGFAHMLNLTDDQKAKVKEVMEANRPKIEAIRQEEMARIKAVMDDSMKQIDPILTPDQKQVLSDMQKLRESREKLQQDKGKAGQ